jgi:hypothetical protein
VGILNEDDTATVIARNNWWGHSSGPYHPDLNPGGTGDEVSDFVEFAPWLTGPYVTAEGMVQPRSKAMGLSPVPNPFRCDVVIRFAIPSPGDASLKVYDRSGREVAILLDDVRPAGSGHVRWRAGDLPRGVYFLRLESPGYSEVFPAIRIDE